MCQGVSLRRGCVSHPLVEPGGHIAVGRRADPGARTTGLLRAYHNPWPCYGPRYIIATCTLMQLPAMGSNVGTLRRSTSSASRSKVRAGSTVCRQANWAYVSVGPAQNPRLWCCPYLRCKSQRSDSLSIYTQTSDPRHRHVARRGENRTCRSMVLRISDQRRRAEPPRYIYCTARAGNME